MSARDASCPVRLLRQVVMNHIEIQPRLVGRYFKLAFLPFINGHNRPPDVRVTKIPRDYTDGAGTLHTQRPRHRTAVTVRA